MQARRPLNRPPPVDATTPLSPDDSAPTPPRSTPRVRLLVFSALILVCFATGLGLVSGVAAGRLVDTDAYTWVHRATELHRTGAWSDDTLQRVNPPTGHTQHWSRPFDVALLAGGVAGEPLVGFPRAVLAWAIVLPVVLGVATLGVLWWGFVDLLDEAGRLALALITPLQPQIVMGFMLGRSDHQALLALVAIGTVTAARRGFTGRASPRAAYASGALAGLGLWIGIEAALVVMGVVAAVALQFVVSGAAVLPRVRRFAGALTVTMLAAALVEHGARGLATAQIDELSPVAIAAAALLTIASHALIALEAHTATPARRATALGAVALAASVVLIAAFPAILDGPLGRVDELYARTRLGGISELQPVVGRSAGLTVYRVALGLSLVPLAALFVVGQVRSRAGVLRHGLHLLLVTAAIYLPLSIAQLRWQLYLALFLLVPAALGTQRLMHAAAPNARRVHLGMALVAVAAALWWLPVTVAATSTMQGGGTPRCAVDDALRQLDLLPETSTVMASVNIGPEILVRTPHDVLSIPNHRPQPGYTATYRAMSTTDADRARRIIDGSSVDAVLVCDDVVERGFYSADPAALHARLVRGDPPTWLRAVSAAGRSPRYLLYEVVR